MSSSTRPVRRSASGSGPTWGEQFAAERNRQIDDKCGSITNVRRIVAAARKEGLLEHEDDEEE